jgi:hypothetical protein
LQYVKQLAKSSLDAKLVKLCDIVANIVDLENSGYSMQKKKKQVDDKLRYFSSIKQSIVMNKMNLVGIDQLLMILNNEVGRYRKIMI